jgi:hypothetical protein
MEKSGIIEILPKEKPWELQRYALSSFKFQDVEKNLVVLATESEKRETLDLIHSVPHKEHEIVLKPDHMRARILLLTCFVIASYVVILWTLTQPTSSPIIFVLAFCIAPMCSILLGTSNSRKK